MNRIRSVRKLCSFIFREHRDKLLGKRFQPKHKPWMRYREIEVVQEILRNLNPVSCLEWGAGYSTLFFPPQLARKASWLAVDHDEAWAREIQNQQPRAIVRIQYVAPNHFPWTDPWQDGAYPDLFDYVEYPQQFAPFDFILVDGRARNDCIRKAVTLIKPEGIVILHDANREYYHPETAAFTHQMLLKGYRKHAGGLWIGSRARAIEEVLDVQFHQRVWRLCRLTGGARIKC